MIGLIDIDGRLPNLALMKIATYYKGLGEQVEFVQEKQNYKHIFAASIFTRSKEICEKLLVRYEGKISIGGTGWDLKNVLPAEMEKCHPDYGLYSAEDIAKRMKGIESRENKLKKAKQIVDAGIGFTSRGCIRQCPFCFVPTKEGTLRQETAISDIINPKSNIIVLHDNNLTADPYCIDKLHEIKDRKLVVDINQGCDVRLMTDDIAKALSEVKHLRSLHYAWDLMIYEKQVIKGIQLLSQYIKPYRHMCFMLVGFDTTFEEDVYRFRRLVELGVAPFVMVYNQKTDLRLKHFARWVNSRIYTACSFAEYEPWIKSQAKSILELAS